MWVALSGEVGFEIVGDDCYYYAVVYAVCVFPSVLLLCMLFVFSVICLCFHVHTRTSTCIHVIDPLPPNTNS